jgi:hypothetical protein
MITKEERNLALDKVHPSFFTVLKSWLINERDNLQSFLNNPTTHVEFNPFAIFDTVKLQGRIDELQNNMIHLSTIESYKQDSSSITEVQLDYALDNLSHAFIKRAKDWIEQKHKGYLDLVNQNKVVNPPNSEYDGVVQVDINKIEYQIAKFGTSLEGLETIHTYLVELEESLKNPSD